MALCTFILLASGHFQLTFDHLWYGSVCSFTCPCGVRCTELWHTCRTSGPVSVKLVQEWIGCQPHHLGVGSNFRAVISAKMPTCTFTFQSTYRSTLCVCVSVCRTDSAAGRNQYTLFPLNATHMRTHRNGACDDRAAGLLVPGGCSWLPSPQALTAQSCCCSSHHTWMQLLRLPLINWLLEKYP